MTKELKRQGKAVTDHHPSISDDDLEAIYSTLNDGNLKTLNLFNIRGGRENLTKLKRSDFAVTADADGAIRVYQTRDEQTKNHQDDSEKSYDGRMYEIKESLRCPVRSFVKYPRRLNPDCQMLFQKARKESKNVVFYNNIVLGHNKLDVSDQQIIRVK